METRLRKRKLAALEAAAGRPNPEAGMQGQDPPLPGADGGASAGGGDRISDLPDGVLGDIISLLPTNQGARTQVLASRWRHLWRSAPLNLDFHSLRQYGSDLDAVVSRILSAHPGPGRRFCAHVYHFVRNQATTADALLRSPALDNLQELELCSVGNRLPPSSWMRRPPPSAAFRFSKTLRVAIIGDCRLPDSTAQELHFPNLKKLELEQVDISESSLHTMIAACPALECLMIMKSRGFSCVRINSITLTSMGMEGHNRRECKELIIENAPRLERLLQIDSSDGRFFQYDSSHPHTMVISAPKLEILGCLSSSFTTRLAFDSAVIQGLRVDSLTSGVCTVKNLYVHMCALSLDAAIDLLKCFPCLEKLYIEVYGPGNTNFWRRKHKDLLRSFDIRLKTIVWQNYRGTKSHVDFATFFLLNAKVLELMILQVQEENYNEKFFAQQRKMLQLHSKASRCARLHFTQDRPYRCSSGFHVHDLDLADPFERKEAYRFFELS